MATIQSIGDQEHMVLIAFHSLFFYHLHRTAAYIKPLSQFMLITLIGNAECIACRLDVHFYALCDAVLRNI